MLPKRSNVLFCRSLSITIACGAVVMLLLFSACSGRHKDMGDAITERDSLPVNWIRKESLTWSLIRCHRYRINTEECWSLTGKSALLGIRKRSLSGKIRLSIQCGGECKGRYSVLLWEAKLWKLMSNVDIQNLKGERFETDCYIGTRTNTLSIPISLSVLSSLTVSSRDMALTPMNKWLFIQ